MPTEVYRKLYETLRRRGGWYGARDIPEFYALAEALFTPEEAEVQCAMPRTPATAEMIAKEMNRTEAEVQPVLEAMADKGCCGSADVGGARWYSPWQFMLMSEMPFTGGSKSERVQLLAKRVHEYRAALDASEGPPKVVFPGYRIVPIEATIPVGNKVQTYEQLSHYVETSDPISVAHCYCRHAARLVDERDDCGKPVEVCMQFGLGAQFFIDRGMGRKVTKEEARRVLREAEDAGLVHCVQNWTHGLDFVCSCCPDHCIQLKIALAQPKPGLALSSGFEPRVDEVLCRADGVCVQACPSKARSIGAKGIAVVDGDRCFGCGLCVTKCPSRASRLVAKDRPAVPPTDKTALLEAVKAAHSRA